MSLRCEVVVYYSERVSKTLNVSFLPTPILSAVTMASYFYGMIILI